MRMFVRTARRVGLGRDRCRHRMDDRCGLGDGRRPLSDDAAVKRLQFMAPLSDKEKQDFSDLWAEVKTAFAG